MDFLRGPLSIFETKICPITGLEIITKPSWQLKKGNYSCKIGLLANSIIIAEPEGYSVKDTTELFLKTIQTIMDSYTETEKFILIDNYKNFKEATKEARRIYISYLNNSPKIAKIIYLGLSRKLYLSVNIGRMINYLNFPIKITHSYQEALKEAIITFKEQNIKNKFFNREIILKTKPIPPVKHKNISKILNNPIVKEYIEEFNRYIMEIKWNDENYELPSIEGIDENHPLHVLREALSIIKSDVGELIKDFKNQNEKLKNTQKELKILNENLENLVNLRTRELKKAKEEAEQSNRGKAVFLASISHELKTPLNSIIGYSSLGKAKTDKLSKEKIKEYFKQINKSGNRLLKLVENLIDITKFEAGVINFNIRKNNISECIIEAVSQIKISANKKNIKLHLNDKCTIKKFNFDRIRIIQVFTNILTNAVKFTPENKNIYIETYNENKNFICKIKDEGIGIPQKETETIFMVFKRGKNAKNISGTGLGLAISQNIIKAHNGSITVKSDSNGSVFTIKIPVK